MHVIVKIYCTKEKKSPYNEWFNSLDPKLRAIVFRRLEKISQGNFGDTKSLKEGLRELRIHIPPGIRIYYSLMGKEKVIIFNGGKKDTQEKDIEKAQEYLKEYQEFLKNQRVSKNEESTHKNGI